MTKKARTFKAFVFFVVCLMLFANMSATVFASDGWQTDFPLPKWTYINIVGGGVLKETDSSGRHTVGGEVLLRDYKNRAEISATVQSFNGDWYNTSYKWSDSGYGGAGVSEAIYLSRGTYRMRLIIKVYSPTNVLLEEATLYTDETII